MKGQRTLQDKPFRYGGILRDYTLTLGQLARKKDCYCYVCNKDLFNEKSYCANYKIHIKGYVRYIFRPLCRECSYAYGKGVIEKNAKTYMNITDCKEEL